MSQGQYGLNAGLALQPDPGFTFVNPDLNYSADTLKNSNAVAIPVTGNYSFWMVENMFMYSPAHKVLGGQFTTLAIVNLANASVTADIPGTRLGVAGGGQGISDTWVQPFNLGWHLGRVDTWVGYAFVAPAGDFFPLSSSNNGSGYWGNNFATGTTCYVTKNKGTQLNLATIGSFTARRREPTLSLHDGVGPRTDASCQEKPGSARSDRL